MAKQATKIKKKPKECDRSDDVEIEYTPVKYPKLKKQVFQGYTYELPIKVLICFEEKERARAIKLMNKEAISFTRVVNDGLKMLLDSKKIEYQKQK